MYRNASIIMSSNYVFAYLNHEVAGQGGTGHGWRMAGALGIPRLDLAALELEGKDIQAEAENLYEKAVEAYRGES